MKKVLRSFLIQKCAKSKKPFRPCGYSSFCLFQSKRNHQNIHSSFIISQTISKRAADSREENVTREKFLSSSSEVVRITFQAAIKLATISEQFQFSLSAYHNSAGSLRDKETSVLSQPEMSKCRLSDRNKGWSTKCSKRALWGLLRRNPKLYGHIQETTWCTATVDTEKNASCRFSQSSFSQIVR